MYKIFNVGLIILLGITMCACKETKRRRKTKKENK